MRFNLKDSEPQNMQTNMCLRVSPTEVWTVCWFCRSAVTGVSLPDQPGKYSMHCHNCGYSADAAEYNDPVFEPHE